MVVFPPKDNPDQQTDYTFDEATAEPVTVQVTSRKPESVFLDAGQRASGGLSYHANFLINLDQ